MSDVFHASIMECLSSMEEEHGMEDERSMGEEHGMEEKCPMEKDIL